MRFSTGSNLLLAGIAAVTVVGASTAQGQVVNNGAVTGTSVQVSTLTTGITLQVTGAVSADGRYVTMDVNPQFSTLEGLDTIAIQDPNGAGTILQAIGNRRVPFRAAQVGKVTFVDKDKPLLAARAPAISLKQTSLKAAMRKVAEGTKSNIVLGIRGLQQEGVDLDAPHDFDVPPGSTKETLLALLKVAAPSVDMVITAEERVISIATQAQADNAVVSKTYYLEDLMANLPRFVSSEVNLYEIGGRPTDQSLDFSTPPSQIDSIGRLFPDPPPDRAVKRVAAPAKTVQKPASPSIGITEVITSTVRPEIWKVNGGKVGEIAVVGNRVTIRAPQSVHALLDGPSHYNPNKVPMYVGYGQ